MQALSSRPVKTFTIGFNEYGYNEAVHANAVAQHLAQTIPNFMSRRNRRWPLYLLLHHDGFSDFADPTFLVSQLAKQHVTVSLSGDGELFCGYNRYLSVPLWNKLAFIPKSIRRLVGGA